MIYSPIIIPTLNRVNHLRRCIDSLKNNSFSKKTELYVSVDFPPSNGRFSDGYEEVCKYARTIDGFKRVYLFYQNTNLGPAANSDFLRKIISEAGYDRYIYTEDDNEFSPNFIEFMDRGLTKFENNSSIVAICASTFITKEDNSKNTYYIKPAFSARGYGTWLSKQDKLYKDIEGDYFKKFYSSLSMRYKVLRLRPNVYQSLSLDALGDYAVIRNENHDIRAIDDVWNLYCIIEKKYCVFPVVNMVRNWGQDGSGVNCGIIEYDPMNTPIDDSKGFVFLNSENTIRLSNRIIKNEVELRSVDIINTSMFRAILVNIGKAYLSMRAFRRLSSTLHYFTKLKNEMAYRVINASEMDSQS